MLFELARLLVLWFLLLSAQPITAKTPLDEPLKELNQKIANLQNTIHVGQQNQLNLAITLQENKNKLSRLHRKVLNLSTQLKTHDLSLKQLQDQLHAQNENLVNQKTNIAQQIKAAYWLSLTENFEAIPYIQFLNQQRFAELIRCKEQIARLNVQHERKQEQMDHLYASLKSRQSAQKSLNRTQLKQKIRLTQLKQTLSQQNRRLQRWLSDRQALMQLLKKLEKKSGTIVVTHRTQRFKQTHAIAHLRGKLSWPVSGVITQRFNTSIEESEFKYTGVTITAIPQSVHTIYRGRVVFAHRFRGLGLLIIVDHGNGYLSLYAHNQSLMKKENDLVNTSEVIAHLGDTQPAKLYFEMRHNGQPLNPEQWCSRR
jgi:murein hydrolase activator